LLRRQNGGAKAMMEFFASMFGDAAIGYAANFTTILVNGGIAVALSTQRALL
jgi:hypothetical protein